MLIADVIKEAEHAVANGLTVPFHLIAHLFNHAKATQVPAEADPALAEELTQAKTRIAELAVQIEAGEAALAESADEIAGLKGTVEGLRDVSRTLSDNLEGQIAARKESVAALEDLREKLTATEAELTETRRAALASSHRVGELEAELVASRTPAEPPQGAEQPGEQIAATEEGAGGPAAASRAAKAKKGADA